MSRALIPPSRGRLARTTLLALATLIASTGSAQGRDIATADLMDAPRSGPGYDISYPQCGGRYPADPAFAIVGVNAGKAFKPNPCLGAGTDADAASASQLAWAGRHASFYMNTGNPGPKASQRWPIGQTYPRPCGTDAEPDPDTADCAYDYGWNAAADAYSTALDAYISLGWAKPGAMRTPVASHWWLDVETANSWQPDTSLNAAALQGAIDYLESVDVGSVGVYSAHRAWWRIVGFTTDFADYPAWVAGASTVAGAQARCDFAAFTGGEVEMTQYLGGGFDANYRC